MPPPAAWALDGRRGRGPSLTSFSTFVRVPLACMVAYGLVGVDAAPFAVLGLFAAGVRELMRREGACAAGATLALVAAWAERWARL